MEERDEEDAPLLSGGAASGVKAAAPNPAHNSRSIVDAAGAVERKKNGLIAMLSVLFVAAVAIIVVLATSVPSSDSGHSSHDVDQDLSADVRSSMSRDTDPCEDFYRYACGGWLDATTIPADHNSWGRSFSTIHERTLGQLKDILEGEQGMESVLYQSCMDTHLIETKGLQGMQPLFDLIESLTDASSALTLAAQLEREGVSPFLSIGIGVDLRHPTRHMLSLGQGGLGLPDKVYYEDEVKEHTRELYVEHINRMLVLSGLPANITLAQDVLAFETKLAQASMKREDLRDPNATYNRETIKSFAAAVSPSQEWLEYINTVLGSDHSPLTDDFSINVETPGFFSPLSKALMETHLATLRAYLRFHTLHAYSGSLTEAVRNETFDFYSKHLHGQEKQLPRWKKCVGVVDALVPDAIGRTYSDIHFRSEDKVAARDLVEHVEAAFKARLPHVPWMNKETREATETKLGQVGNLIGFPDTWVDYGDLGSRMNKDMLNNVRVARQFEISRELRKLDQEVDRREWEMSSPTVNAYYDPSKNIMVFPAGILQSPFFDKELPAAMNFGAIGAVMGHELTHGFDDEGRKYTGNGTLAEWWKPEVVAEFEKAATCVDDQFDQFPVPGATDGSMINGKLTLGENIADLGGMKSAFFAFQEHKRTRSAFQAAEDYPSHFRFLSEDQLFFVSYAQSWCEKVRPQYSQLLATTDPHSPPQYRVQGPLTNFDEFAKAFQCSADAAYNRQDDQRCTVW